MCTLACYTTQWVQCHLLQPCVKRTSQIPVVMGLIPAVKLWLRAHNSLIPCTDPAAVTKWLSRNLHRSAAAWPGHLQTLAAFCLPSKQRCAGVMHISNFQIASQHQPCLLLVLGKHLCWIWPSVLALSIPFKAKFNRKSLRLKPEQHHERKLVHSRPVLFQKLS